MNGVQILIVIGAGIAVSAFARGRGLQPGVFIVVLAAAAGFLPGMPRLELDGEVILALVVPPLLYSGARGASVTAFGQNLRAIISLGLSLVLLTAGVLGLLASWLLPSIGLAAAFTLGAILAPPDTITTVSHGDEIGLPRRVTSILTGESLVNDATALTLFSLALAALEGDGAGVGTGVVRFLYNSGVGIAIGVVLGTATMLLRKRLGNPTLETALVLLVPFTAYLAAEQVHASGILAVVTAAFGITINISLDPNFQYPGAYLTRLQEDAFWPVVDFLLETFVFAYIGLQLRFVLAELAATSKPGLARTLIAAFVLLLVAIVFRLLAVQVLFGRRMLMYRWGLRRLAAFDRMREHLPEQAGTRGNPPDAVETRRRFEAMEPPSPRETFLIGWTGMRGILTLAAAAAVPAVTSKGEDVTGRDAIAAIALIVTLGTLLIQGTTLRLLVGWLGLDTATERAREAELRAHGQEIVRAAVGPDGPLTDEDYDRQRAAVGSAVRSRELDEDTARRLIAELDLRQAAGHTLD